MSTRTQIPPIVEQKLATFERLQPEFEACFRFVEEVHGQKRFSVFPVADTVRYLHALWLCECKTHLLSIARTVKDYEGKHCLELLRRWQQEGDTASVVAFLHRNLDMLPLADISRQIQEAQQQQTRSDLVPRLLHGRSILLNRGINLMQALDAIFARSEEELSASVGEACERYGHLPQQIEQQMAELNSPLYAFVPHQLLAQRNMTVMNRLGVDVALKPADLPGRRSWRVAAPAEPLQPFAEHIVQGYVEFGSAIHNNILVHRFVDRPERSDDATI